MIPRDLLARAVLDGTTAEVLEAVDDALADGSATLWERPGSAAITQDQTYRELSLAAGSLSDLLEMLTEAEADAKAKGCGRMIAVGRKGWARVLPGYREITVLVKEL